MVSKVIENPGIDRSSIMEYESCILSVGVITFEGACHIFILYLSVDMI